MQVCIVIQFILQKSKLQAAIWLDWIIQSLLLVDRDWIVLPRLSIDRSQFGRAEITVNFMNFFAIFQLKQLYFKHIFLL